MRVHFAQLHRLGGKGGVVLFLLRLEVPTDFLLSQFPRNYPRLADHSPQRHRQAHGLAVGIVIERKLSWRVGRVEIGADEPAVAVKLLVTPGVLDEDELAPGVDRHVVQRDEGERHPPVAVDRAEE